MAKKYVISISKLINNWKSGRLGTRQWGYQYRLKILAMK